MILDLTFLSVSSDVAICLSPLTFSCLRHLLYSTHYREHSES